MASTPYVAFTAGVTIGSLLIAHRSQLIAVLVAAVLLQSVGGLIFGIFEQPLTAFLQSVVYVGLCAVVGATAYWLRYQRRRQLVANELFATAAFAACLVAPIYGYVFHDEGAVAIPFDLSAISATIAFLLGAAAIAPLISVLAMPIGRPYRYGPARVLSIVVAGGLTMVCSIIGLSQWPVAGYQFLAPFEHFWIWAAIMSAIVLSLRARAELTMMIIVGMLLIAAFGLENGLLAGVSSSQEQLLALIEWQTTALAIIVITIATGALSGGLRRSEQQHRTRGIVAREVLTARDESSGDEDKLPNLTNALKLVAGDCNAVKARLYWIDTEADECGCLFYWSQEDNQPLRGSQAKVDMTLLPWFFDRILSGKEVTFSHDPILNPDRPDILDVLVLPETCSLYFQPIIYASEVIGMIGVIGDHADDLWTRDAEPLLNIVAEFYSGFRAREKARVSIESFEQQLRELAARFSQAEERVRRLTSVELHDGLIQQLAVARMKLGELRQRRVTSPDTVAKITDIVDETLAASRSIIQQLSPSVLYELGLMPGLAHLCDELQSGSDFTIKVQERGERAALDEPLRVAIYQVVRELLENAIQHSGGSNVWLVIQWGQASLEQVSVADDGKAEAWWLPATESTQGLGLLSARERLRPFDFALRFEQRDGGGTNAVVVLQQHRVGGSVLP